MKGQGTIFSSETLIGAHIENSHGQVLGRLEDLVVDPESGDVVYALLYLEGLSGSDKRYFAIPWQALFIESDTRPVTVNVKKESIGSALNVDEAAWSLAVNLHRL